MRAFIYKLFSLKDGEFKLLVLSCGFIFMLFSSYAILRPMRDALGLEGGQEELKWLFLATFIACILASLLLMWLSTKIKRRFYADCVFIFFALNLLIFYALMWIFKPHTAEFIWLSRVFYVWISVFNLFAFSSAWSLLTDVFNKEESTRLFGIISAGASLGSIAGASSVSILVANFGVANLVFLSIALLFIGIILKNLILRELKYFENVESLERFNQVIGSKNPFIGFKLIIASKYLLALCAFILLLTSVSTFLYMEQARIIREVFPTREARIAAFANIDLIVQISALFIQIFLTAKIVKFLGITYLLSTLGFVITLGFIVLSFTHPAFLPLAVVMSIRRVGEYALVKPGREMLFVPLDADSKYKVKNFFDTVVYRGGDALSAQAESLLANVGILCVLLCSAAISFVWGILGVFLGKSYKKTNYDSL
ncbi:NTP/NDP exchange transporter [Helicobacter sp. UBA3407]|uniref:NTP/NDP exchange transporter n=1 Tax=Helicobacter sp. UBA3407 TaxID=1946588 RepID=UPI00260C95E7|nr:MFS transporter [Helicobacter sp. UBA3407]